MLKTQSLAAVLSLFLLGACSAAPDDHVDAEQAVETLPQGLPEETVSRDVHDARIRGVLRPVRSQTIYVPVYSHIYYRDETRPFDLTATLSIRNTDPDHAMTVTGIRYYDSNGRLVRNYRSQPLELPPLASTHVVVAEEDRTGGVGANFIIDWQSTPLITAPIVEAVMISTASSQGISFVTPGRVIAEAVA